jgi:hypothetical protein
MVEASLSIRLASRERPCPTQAYARIFTYNSDHKLSHHDGAVN